MASAPVSDRAIWDYARDNGFVIVSSWVRLGNCSTDDVNRLLRMRHREIEAFVAHEEAAFLALA